MRKGINFYFFELPTELLQQAKEFKKTRGVPVAFQLREGLKLFLEKHKNCEAK